jgi:hypothetical protein
LAPDSATTSFHTDRSLAAKASASYGVLERQRAPTTRKRFWISGSAAICFMAPASLSMIGHGVPSLIPRRTSLSSSDLRRAKDR